MLRLVARKVWTSEVFKGPSYVMYKPLPQTDYIPERSAPDTDIASMNHLDPLISLDLISVLKPIF